MTAFLICVQFYRNGFWDLECNTCPQSCGPLDLISCPDFLFIMLAQIFQFSFHQKPRYLSANWGHKYFIQSIYNIIFSRWQMICFKIKQNKVLLWKLEWKCLQDSLVTYFKTFRQKNWKKWKYRKDGSSCAQQRSTAHHQVPETSCGKCVLSEPGQRSRVKRHTECCSQPNENCTHTATTEFYSFFYYYHFLEI